MESDSHENDSAPSEQRKADEHTDHAEPPVLPATAKLEMPPAKPHCCESYKTKKHWLDYATFGLAILGFAALCVYAALTFGIYCANKKAAQIASDTLGEIRQQERPWIGLDTSHEAIVFYEDIEIHGRVPSDEKAWTRFVLRYSLQNFGKSPAEVVVHAKAVDSSSPGYPQHDDPLLIQAVKEFCDSGKKNRKADAVWPATIIPGTEPYNDNLRYTVSEGSEEMKPTIIGCIWYRATQGDTTIHETQFSGNISLKKKNGRQATDLSPIQIPVSTGKRIPKGDLEVVDVMMMGTAD